MRFFILPAVVLITLMLVIGAVRVSAAPFVNPVTPAPGGNVAPFLNTSSFAQTKLGGLSVQDLVVGDNPSDALNVGRTDGSSRICWNGVCKNSWDEVVQLSDKLQLRPASGYDLGVIQIVGPAGPTEPVATVAAQAGKPSTSPTHGIYAQAAGGPAGTDSYGVYGQATVDGHYAVYATNGGNISAWAAYFEGDVAVTTKIDGTPSDFYIGENMMNNDNFAQLCLNGDCRREWPAPGSGGLWGLNSTLNGDYLYPTTVTRSLGVGGSASNASFSVAVTADANGLPQRADLSVRADAQFDEYVVGTAPASLPVTVTCGDGQCNGSENDNFCSPRPSCGSYCPEDCDVTAPNDIVIIQRTIFDATKTVRYIWQSPSGTPDYAGTRIVRMVGRSPTGPNDPGGTYADRLVGNNLYETPPNNVDTQYYYGFYAYDNHGYYSPGVIELVYFSSGGGGEDGGGGEKRR